MYIHFQITRPNGSGGDKALKALLPHADAYSIEGITVEENGSKVSLECWCYVVPVSRPTEITFAYEAMDRLQGGRAYGVKNVAPYVAIAKYGNVPTIVPDFYQTFDYGASTSAWYDSPFEACSVLATELADALTSVSTDLSDTKRSLAVSLERTAKDEAELKKLYDERLHQVQDGAKLAEDLKAATYDCERLKAALDAATENSAANRRFVQELEAKLLEINSMSHIRRRLVREIDAAAAPAG